MAMLDKLKFWKKKDTLDFTDPFAGHDTSLGGGNLGSDPMGLPQSTIPGLQQEQPDQEYPSFGMKPPSHENASASFSSPQSSPTYATESTPMGPDVRKDIELLSAKMDTIKVMLEHLNHRLDNLERMAENQDSPIRRRGRW
jgi:hypothetical protein